MANWDWVRSSVRTSKVDFDTSIARQKARVAAWADGCGPLSIRDRDDADRRLLAFADTIGLKLHGPFQLNVEGKRAFAIKWEDLVKYCGAPARQPTLHKAAPCQTHHTPALLWPPERG